DFLVASISCFRISGRWRKSGRLSIFSFSAVRWHRSLSSWRTSNHSDLMVGVCGSMPVNVMERWLFDSPRMSKISPTASFQMTALDAQHKKMIDKKRKIFRPSILLVGAAGFSLLIAAFLYFQTAGAEPPQVEPIDVVKNYLKARYARDYQNAYRYISS